MGLKERLNESRHFMRRLSALRLDVRTVIGGPTGLIMRLSAYRFHLSDSFTCLLPQRYKAQLSMIA